MVMRRALPGMQARKDCMPACLIPSVDEEIGASKARIGQEFGKICLNQWYLRCTVDSTFMLLMHRLASNSNRADLNVQRFLSGRSWGVLGVES